MTGRWVGDTGCVLEGEWCGAWVACLIARARSRGAAVEQASNAHAKLAHFVARARRARGVHVLITRGDAWGPA